MSYALSDTGHRASPKSGAPLLARFRLWLERRRDARCLAKLDDRMLRDIGLTRYDIAELARGNGRF